MTLKYISLGNQDSVAMAASLRPALLSLLAALCAAAAAPRLILTVLQYDYGNATATFNQAQPTRETRTPNMDALAASGTVLTRHYAHSFCSPTRSSFLSGRLPVHVQAANVQPDQPNCGIPAAMTTLPQKLAALGWESHVAGKWDVSMADRRHTPEGRGFNSSLVFFSHAIDAFLHRDVDGLCNQTFVDLWDSGAPARALNGTGYFDDLALARLLHVIAAHDFEGGPPLYLHFTPHATHNPLQAPRPYLEALNYTSSDESLCQYSVNTSPTGAVFPGGPAHAAIPCRRAYEAMAAHADAAMGALVAAITAAGQWERTLLVWQSDNGGSVDLRYGGGSNHPLRGGKGTWWEGGMRVAAVVGGGYLPPAARGRRTGAGALTHTADWLATLCGVAGGGSAFCSSDAAAAAAGLPPPDSLDLWPLLSGATSASPRAAFPASATALVSGRYKLLLGDVGGASWTGPFWPNASSPQADVLGVVAHCGAGGCVYDVEGDPGEHVDVAGALPGVAAALRAQLAAEVGRFWSNNESGVCAHNASLSVHSDCACDAARVVWGGFLGPFLKE
jgi:arylsulfatase B